MKRKTSMRGRVWVLVQGLPVSIRVQKKVRLMSFLAKRSTIRIRSNNRRRSSRIDKINHSIL